MEIVDIHSVDRGKWRTLVAASPMATWFQTPEAYDFYCSLSFVEPFGIAVTDVNQVQGLVLGWIQKDGHGLKRWLSRRAIVFGGPLLADDVKDEALNQLLLGLGNVLKGRAIYLETRNFNDYSHWRNLFETCGFHYEPHYNVQVDTPSLETVKAKLDRNRRRNIKKATENGLTIGSDPDEMELKCFYAMLENLYQTKVKTPLYPVEFFKKLRSIPDARFFMAKSPEGDLLGGLVCVCLKGQAVYAWMACGDDRQYKELSPSVMANYAGICFAAENDFQRFDFMGAGKPDDGGYGVRDFKLKFGGNLVEHGRFVYVYKPLLYRVGKLGVNLMKRF